MTKLIVSMSALALALAASGAQAQSHDHSQMDHGSMDHSKMNHGQKKEEPVDHKKMDHGQMGHHGSSPDSNDGETICITPAKSVPYSEGSGTSRLPGGGHMMSVHQPGSACNPHGWAIMPHGFVSTVYTNQSGPRGDDKLYVQSMLGLMAERSTDWGRVQLKSMFSLEPLMSNRGYPNLFATGETAGGEPLVDRQHPHDFFMELAARIDFNIADDTSLFVYGGPVGEPALGPSAFMHRGSARYNPEAPISHHWFDSTHITYGVATAGLATSKLQIEGSAFTGREPDEQRWGIDKMRFDSWSARATWNPTPSWSAQISTARMKQPEPLHIGQDEQRTTASILYANGSGLSGTLAFSAKNRLPGRTLEAWLAEANWDLNEHHSLFGRIENVENDELFPDHHDPLHDQPFRVTKLQGGYAYRLPLTGPLNLALGGTVSTFLKPDALDAHYGKSPMGYTLFAKLSLGH